MISIPYTTVLLLRFLSGKELDGDPRTDARWAHRGQEDFGYRSSRWHHQSYRRRAAIRIVVTFAIVFSVYESFIDSESLYSTYLVVLWLIIAIVVWLVVHFVRKWEHYQRWYPGTAASLGERLNISRHVPPSEWIYVPVGHRSDPDKVSTIKLPYDYSGSERAQESLAHLAAERLELIDYQYDYTLSDEGNFVLNLWTTPRPPDKVSFSEVREFCENTSDTELVLGIDADDKPLVVSLESDSPHIMASVGPGGGKTTLQKFISLQGLYKGCRIILIDCVKRGASGRWAKNVPGIEIYRHPDVAHDVLIELLDLIEKRCENKWNFDDPDPDQRIIFVIEEANQTIRRLQNFWINELNGKKTSPAVLAIEGILCVGREANVNGVAVGQRMSAQASGGGDARENYGVIIANRFSPQTARMLFADIDPLPKSSNQPGRVQVVTGGVAREIQIPLCKGHEPIEWALEGLRRSPHYTDLVSDTSDSPSDDRRGNVIPLVKSVALRHTAVEDATTEKPIGLTEAVTQSVVTCSINVLRSARANDPEFPKPVGSKGTHKTAEHLFNPSDLILWDRNRSNRSG